MTCFGIIASFSGPDPLVEAVRRLHQAGYRRMDAFSPFPVEGLAEALGMAPTRLPYIVLAGALLGAGATYGLILYSVLADYPINAGGRGLHSWPAFIVLAFEGGILGAALAAFLGMLAANGLPQYYHPAFNSTLLSAEAGGNFCILIEAGDPAFDREKTTSLLRRMGAREVAEVDP